jgi:hypothetical protein
MAYSMGEKPGVGMCLSRRPLKKWGRGGRSPQGGQVVVSSWLPLLGGGIRESGVFGF